MEILEIKDVIARALGTKNGSKDVRYFGTVSFKGEDFEVYGAERVHPSSSATAAILYDGFDYCLTSYDRVVRVFKDDHDEEAFPSFSGNLVILKAGCDFSTVSQALYNISCLISQYHAEPLSGDEVHVEKGFVGYIGNTVPVLENS